MIEPASAFGLVNRLTQIIDYCCYIIRRAHRAPDEIKRLNGQASNWRPQLESLAEHLEGDSPSAARLRKKFEDGGLQDVYDLFKELNDLLEPFQKLTVFQKLRWSTQTGNKVTAILDQLQQDVGRILGIFQLEILRILETQVETTHETERRNILLWLKPKDIDCHEFHRQKRDLREEGTCDWLAKSWPWLDWCKGGSPLNSRFLWIHGLPGAGKTVLASFAIDHVASEYQHKGVSYYYCSHERQKRGHTSSEEARSFLRWVIRDLTAQVTRPNPRNPNHQATIPKTLHDLYVRHDFDIQSLLDCLLSVTEYVSTEFKQKVCIIIDAVDESPTPRDALLNILTTIGTDPTWQHVSICFTSRKEQDISEAINAIQPAQPDESVQVAQPTQPIRRLVSATVQNRVILDPVRPSERQQKLQQLQQERGEKTHGHDASGASQADSDDRSPFGNAMLPPAHVGTAWQRGRMPSGGASDFSISSQRASRSEVRQPVGQRPSRRSGPERSASITPEQESYGADAMDIDYPIQRCAEGCTILSMDENPEVRQAIRTFVRNQLHNQCLLKGGDKDLDEVITLIANKAKGMFRWAACQVDIIIRSNLCDVASISAMLERVPKDIFGAYEHMIMKLLPGAHGQNELNRNFARTALALLCSPTSAVSCAEVLVEASRFHIPHGVAHDYSLPQLQKILGCLITVIDTPKSPETIYGRQKENENAKKKVSVAHYTVKEYLFDESTARGKVKDFALSTEAIQNLELEVVFRGLEQFKTDRPAGGKPTRYEEYCLKMTDKALKQRRDLILRDKTIWKIVTNCLRWNSNHHMPKSGAFPNMKVRAAFSSWTKTSPFEQSKEPKNPETSVLVSLLLLKWPRLAVSYLADLSEATKKEIWKDKFELTRGFRVEGTEPTSLIQMCVTRRDINFLQVLVNSRADFSGESDLIMNLFFHAYGHRSLDDEDDGTKTGRMLNMLLERGVRPEAPRFVFTPLQFAVSNLEDRWVDELLRETADPNATGNPNGLHPFGEDDDDLGHLTPLQICQVTRPQWLQSDDDDEITTDQLRVKVASALRQWGAVDVVESIELDSD